MVALWYMTEGTSSDEENANLYTRGVNEGRAGEFLDGEELLAILDIFGEDGLRAYIVGHLEGFDDAMEGTKEEASRVCLTRDTPLVRRHEGEGGGEGGLRAGGGTSAGVR